MDPKKILLGEGAIYFNYTGTGDTPVGATRGGGKFTRNVEIKEIEFDGRRGPTKGARRKTGASALLSFNMLEIDATNLTKFYAGLQATDKTTYTEITAKEDIEDADYLTNVAFVGKTKKGDPVIIILKNALGDGNMELALQDKEEVVPEVQWTGHADPATPKVEPWEIRWPKVVA